MKCLHDLHRKERVLPRLIDGPTPEEEKKRRARQKDRKRERRGDRKKERENQYIHTRADIVGREPIPSLRSLKDLYEYKRD